jgi:hypothetical protein
LGFKRDHSTAQMMIKYLRNMFLKITMKKRYLVGSIKNYSRCTNSKMFSLWVRVPGQAGKMKIIKIKHLSKEKDQQSKVPRDRIKLKIYSALKI